jgi:hypothetical protein
MYFTDDSLYPENMQPLIITAALRRDHRNDNECSRLRSRLVTRQKSPTKKSWSPLHEGYLTKQYE